MSSLQLQGHKWTVTERLADARGPFEMRLGWFNDKRWNHTTPSPIRLTEGLGRLGLGTTHLTHERREALLKCAPELVAADASETDGQRQCLVDVRRYQLCESAAALARLLLPLASMQLPHACCDGTPEVFSTQIGYRRCRPNEMNSSRALSGEVIAHR